ncbi:hypothetical protein GW17_00004079 [Ensete ventricosum]|nr:hypothetical protein GW17_00004079 [Ensete ventricosum]
MIVEPEQRVPDFIKAGADIVSVHCEQSSTIHLHRTVNQVILSRIDIPSPAGCEGNDVSRVARAATTRDRPSGGEGTQAARRRERRPVLSNFPLSTWAVVDLVLIMSVNPGFGGQSFIESQVKKISELRRLCAEKVRMNNISSFFKSAFWEQWDMHFIVFPDMQGVNPWIEVDGGVGPSNAYKVPLSKLVPMPLLQVLQYLVLKIMQKVQSVYFLVQQLKLSYSQNYTLGLHKSERNNGKLQS